MAKHRRGADFLCDTGLELFSQHPRAGMLVTKKLNKYVIAGRWPLERPQFLSFPNNFVHQKKHKQKKQPTINSNQTEPIRQESFYQGNPNHAPLINKWTLVLAAISSGSKVEQID
jgi:hypothetical protein